MQEITYILFTTTGCPKCPAFQAWTKEFLSSLSGQHIDNTMPNFLEQAERFSVICAPTLLLLRNGQEIARAEDASMLSNILTALA